MAAPRAPATPFDKLAAAFGATARNEAREGGAVEVFVVPREQVIVEVSLARGAAPCLVVRAHEEEAAPTSGFRKNVLLRARARLVYPAIKLRRVTSLDRVNALLALRPEVRTGDVAFDRAVSVEGDLSDESIAPALASKAARDAVLQALQAGFEVHFEDRAVRADLPSPTDSHLMPATVTPVVEALVALVGAVPRADAATFTKRPQLGRFIAGTILVIGLLATAALAPGTLDDGGIPIRPLPPPLITVPAMLPGLLVGVGLFALSFLALRWQLKRRNASTDLPVILALFIVLALLGVGGLDATNRLMDEEPLVTHDVKVVSKYTGKSRRSGAVIDWTLAVPSWRPGGAQLELSVGPEMHREIRVGDQLRVSVHPGFLGWEWGAVIERMGGGTPEPPALPPGERGEPPREREPPE